MAEKSQQITTALNVAPDIPVKVIIKPALNTPEAISKLCLAEYVSPNCAALITWMHTFSPAKMWIASLRLLQKPFLHLHTSFNREISRDVIDLDFMNLNQSAHGDREFGFSCARLGLNRKGVVDHCSS